MRRILAIAVFSSLAISGSAQSSAPGPAMFAFIDNEGQRRNVRLILPDGTEVRAERMTLNAGSVVLSVAGLAEEARVMLGTSATPREYVLSGEVKLIFPARK